MVVHTSILGYFQKTRQKVPTVINMADTGEIECTLVPNTTGKSDLRKHLNIKKQKTDGKFDADVAVCQQCSSIVKCVGSALSTSTHMKCHNPLLLFGAPAGNKQKANMLVCISQYFIPVWTKNTGTCTGTFFGTCTQLSF